MTNSQLMPLAPPGHKICNYEYASWKGRHLFEAQRVTSVMVSTHGSVVPLAMFLPKKPSFKPLLLNNWSATDSLFHFFDRRHTFPDSMLDHPSAWWLAFRSVHFGHKGQCSLLKIARLLIGDQAVKWTLLMVCIPVSAPSIHCWIMLFWIQGGSFVDCRQLVESTSGWPELRAFFASAPINGWPGKHSWPAKDKTRRIESRNAIRKNEQIYFEKEKNIYLFCPLKRRLNLILNPNLIGPL